MTSILGVKMKGIWRNSKSAEKRATILLYYCRWEANGRLVTYEKIKIKMWGWLSRPGVTFCQTPLDGGGLVEGVEIGTLKSVTQS